MAVIYTYPQATDLESVDLFLVSKMKEEGRPTRSISASSLANSLAPFLSFGTVTSVGLSIDEPTALSVNPTSTPVTTSGTLALEWNGDNAQVVLGDGTLGTFASGGTVTSVGLSGPSAFSVSGSPVTASGTLTFTGAGTALQYIDGTGSLQLFPTIPSVPTNIVETVDTTDGTYINLTPATAQSGNIVVTADLSASGTASGTTFLRGDNTWATIPGGTTDVKQLDVVITPAQMLSLNGGNTIQLLPAPGSDKIYTILNALTNLKFNTIAFNFGTSGPSDSVSLKLGTTFLSNDFGLTTTNLNSAASTYFIGDPVGAGASVQVPVNVALNLTSSSGITVSQGDSSVRFSILYREIDYNF